MVTSDLIVNTLIKYASDYWGASQEYAIDRLSLESHRSG
jgi:hypothetical protein